MSAIPHASKYRHLNTIKGSIGALAKQADGKAKDSKVTEDGCPACLQVGGYCGGSGHPNCGNTIVYAMEKNPKLPLTPSRI